MFVPVRFPGAALLVVFVGPNGYSLCEFVVSSVCEVFFFHY